MLTGHVVVMSFEFRSVVIMSFQSIWCESFLGVKRFLVFFVQVFDEKDVPFSYAVKRRL